MGIWDTEVIRVDGNLFAYIKVQNDYSGNVSGSFRRIYQDKQGHYYAKADGRNQNMDNKLSPEEKVFLSVIIFSIILMILAMKFLTGASRPPKQMENTHICKDIPNYIQEEYCYMILRGKTYMHILSYADEQLICRCIMREAGGESDEGQQAVATVIFNRLFSPNFPDTINEIIVPGQFEVCDDYDDVTQQVKINLQRAIIDYNTRCQSIPYNCYYFRADKYHDFGIPYRQIGNNYFSLSEEATD